MKQLHSFHPERKLKLQPTQRDFERILFYTTPTSCGQGYYTTCSTPIIFENNLNVVVDLSDHT